jgi:hypothetical protein
MTNHARKIRRTQLDATEAAEQTLCEEMREHKRFIEERKARAKVYRSDRSPEHSAPRARGRCGREFSNSVDLVWIAWAKRRPRAGTWNFSRRCV